MDLTPSFGHQELLESFSHSSAGSRGGNRSTASSIASRSVTNQQQNNNNSVASSKLNVDEAYRRLGQRLSIQAHGDAASAASAKPQNRRISPSPKSCFRRYSGNGRAVADGERDDVLADELSASDLRFRTSKVAKTNYADHGEQGRMNGPEETTLPLQQQNANKDSILKRLTFCAKDQFRIWQEAEPQHLKSASSLGTRSTTMSAGEETAPSTPATSIPNQSSHNTNTPVSPQHYAAFATLDIESSLGRLRTASDGSAGHRSFSGQTGHHMASLMHRHRHDSLAMAPPPGKGLLSAVLEGQSETSQSASVSAPGQNGMTHQTSPEPTLSTNESSLGMFQAGRTQLQRSPRGKCLTLPCEGVANDGLDNMEGNMIVYENDVIGIPKKSIHTLQRQEDGTVTKQPQSQSSQLSEYMVLSALGQGTFAQVFRCLHLESGETVAIKIVKNKPAYTRQAAVEIDIFRALREETNERQQGGASASVATSKSLPSSGRNHMVNLQCFFMYQSHLCLVFELLGLNLYEILKRRQFRGLPLSHVRTVVQQAVVACRDLAQKNIVHCDLKPENVLLVSEEDVKDAVYAGDSRSTSFSAMETTGVRSKGTDDAMSTGEGVPKADVSEEDTSRTFHDRGQIKLIDFGSACFEGYTAHTYIQSRFYRSPEVLVGLPYDSAIDMWSLGCVAAELFLGLPILPGVHEHDQLVRISEMIHGLPDWMMEQGGKSTKFFVKFVPRSSPRSSDGSAHVTPSPVGTDSPSSHSAPALPQWRLKTQQEFITSLSQSEIRKKGGLEKLAKQPGNRYFNRKRLADILFLHAQSTGCKDKNLVPAFVHFLYGLLDPDPWKRWTAFQAVQHPFVTGDVKQLRKKTPDMKFDPKEENLANLELDVVWQAPWDPAICRRKLLNVQRLREKQQAMRRGQATRPQGNVSTEFAAPADRRFPTQHNTSDDERLLDNVSHLLGSSPPSNVLSDVLSRNPLNQSTNQQYRRASSDQYGPLLSSLSMAASMANIGSNESSQLVATDEVLNGRAARSTSLSAVQGARSFTGADVAQLQQAIQGDFAYALQRPGVVPGTGSSPALSISTHGQNVGTPSQFQQPAPQDRNSRVSAQNSASMGMPYNAMLHAQQQQPVLQQQMQMLPQMQATMPGMSGYGNVQGGNFSAQQQMALQLQQQQAFAMQQQQIQFQLPQGQQPIPQVFLASAPGGGYYYVTMSATGQPMLLQPVGVINQQPQVGFQDSAPATGYAQPMGGFSGPTFVQQNYQQQQPQHQQGWLQDPYAQSQAPMPHGQQQQQRRQPPPSNQKHAYYPRGGTSM